MKIFILILILLAGIIPLAAYTISGQTNLIDSPVEGAVLELYSQQPHMNNSLIDVVYSDDSGFYTFEIIEPGMYYVAAIIESPVYQSLFYDNVANPCQAAPIQVNNMHPVYSDIDFEFQPTIPSGNNTLSGEVLNLNGNAVEAAKLVLHHVQYSHPWMSPFITYSDSNGNYLLENLPDGEYLLSVRHQSYYRYFYNGASSWMQADEILLENGALVNIDIVLEANEDYIVSGIVSDSQSGLPLEAAQIFAFSQTGHQSNCGNGGGNFPTAVTDETGFYELYVSAGLYHFMALDPQTNSVIFYENAATPISATWLEVNGNLENIDFQLNANAGGEYSISGTLTHSGNPSNPIPLLAVAVSSDEDWEETVMADNFNGGYIIPDLPSDSYYVYGFSPTALPTYYEDAINFEEAVLVDLQSNINGIDIVLHAAQENGYNECTGIVSDEIGNPVTNATVAFVDAFGNVHDYAFTDQNGEYFAPALGSLNYTALATKTFYASDSILLPVYGNQTWDFVLSATSTDAENNLIFNDLLIPVAAYPNPFNPVTTIKFDLPAFSNHTLIEIFNTRGQKVYRKMMSDLPAGSHSISWQAQDDEDRNLGSGIYLLMITADEFLGKTKLLLLK